MPPLNALRSFEAAARHLSFSRAARELGVTPAAVGHQVKGLEDYFSLPLFYRNGRSLLLTPDGQSLLPILSDAFDRIERSSHDIEAGKNTNLLTVTATAAFAAYWLLPRLHRFQQRRPDIQVRLAAASQQVVDFERDEIDVGIRYGSGLWSGLSSVAFLTEAVAPTCSPILLEGDYPLRTPNDLRHQTLIHEDSGLGWKSWLELAGVSGVDYQVGPRFRDANLALQYALDGRGVVLTWLTLAQSQIASGRLVKLFDVTIPTDFKYYIVSSERMAADPHVVAFREWLQEEARMNDQSEWLCQTKRPCAGR